MERNGCVLCRRLILVLVCSVEGPFFLVREMIYVLLSSDDPLPSRGFIITLLIWMVRCNYVSAARVAWSPITSYGVTHSHACKSIHMVTGPYCISSLVMSLRRKWSIQPIYLTPPSGTLPISFPLPVLLFLYLKWLKLRSQPQLRLRVYNSYSRVR